MSCQEASSVMKTKTSCGLRRDNVGSHQHHSKREALVSAKPLGGGRSVERARSPRMLGEYGLYLVLKDGHFHAFQVLIKVFFFEKPTRTIALSKKYPRTPCVSFHFNSLHIILPSLPCLFQAVPLGAGEVTGDSWGRKRM